MHPKGPCTLVTCSIRLRLCPGEADKAARLLRSVVGYTEAEPGCVSCTASRDITDPDCLHYNGSWTSDAAFRRHVQSESFRPVLVAVDMAVEEPRVTVGQLCGQEGLAYLIRLCCSGKGGANEGDR
jgi:quinol monooxygenase YgiN